MEESQDPTDSQNRFRYYELSDDRSPPASVKNCPLSLAGGDPGKEILQPMAIVMIGGLVSSTLLSLALTPAAYWLLGDNRREASNPS